VPLLALTIVTNTLSSSSFGGPGGHNAREDPYGNEGRDGAVELNRERETIVSQEIPVRVLNPAQVEGLHEPRCREPDVHILLPPLMQLKSISDRFTKLAMTSNPATGGGSRLAGPKLEMSANMHGCLRMSIHADAMNISSLWTNLSNPELDPTQVEGGEEGIREHPSTRMKQLGSADGKSEEGWATVRIDGKDWGKVMSVGRLGGRVIACEIAHHTSTRPR
jgi:HUS1 checkpoint protein